MNNLATLVMAGALLVLIVTSLASFFGFTTFNDPRYLSEGLGRTGYILLIITAIGGLVYWAGRLK